MIIKYYALDGSLYIIDDAHSLRVVYDERQLGPCVIMNFDVPQLVEYDEKEFDKLNPVCAFVCYTKEMSHALKVFGTAYICNNDGKPIEKVSI